MLRQVWVASAVLSVSTCFALLAGQATEQEAAKNAGKNSDEQKATAAQDQEKAHADHEHKHGHWKNADHGFASCVALENQVEVTLGQMGAKKAQNEEVKKFAEMLVSDHQAYLAKLKTFAPECTEAACLESGKHDAKSKDRQSRASTATADEDKKSEENQPSAKSDSAKSDDDQNDRKDRDQAAKSDKSDDSDSEKSGKVEAGKGHHHGHHAQLAKVELELAQQCLMSSKEALEEKSGAEFDKCFVGMQIAKHVGMRDRLIVFQRHVSPELAEILSAGQKKTEQHLAMAKEIMKKLEQSDASPK